MKFSLAALVVLLQTFAYADWNLWKGKCAIGFTEAVNWETGNQLCSGTYVEAYGLPLSDLWGG